MTNRLVLAGVLATLLAGCAANGGGTAPQAGAPAVPVAGSPKVAMSTEQGIVIHDSSGMQFPNSAGGFQRLSVSSAAAREIAGGYVLPLQGAGIVAVVHVYPTQGAVTPGAPDNGEFAFELRKSNIVLLHKDARTVTIQQPATILQQGLIRRGFKAVFEYTDLLGGQRQPVHTELYSFAPAGPGFAIEYRFTYPAALDPGQNITNFLEVLPWTFRGLR